jgi:hypothetical protein
MYFNPSSSPFLIGKDVRGELRAVETKAEVERLRIDVERLFMISEALWRLLKEKHGYSDEQFEDLVTQIDMEDGRLDGRVAPTEKPNCPKCDAKLSGGRPVCIFCGTQIIQDPFQR